MESKLKFSGYWVTSQQGNTEVTIGEFDDTELSDHSNWTEAWQNEDPSAPHGFIDPFAMLHEVSAKIAGKPSGDDLKVARDKFSSGTSCAVNSLEDLVRLIQLVVPSTTRKP
jgi:hypothetical protein